MFGESDYERRMSAIANVEEGFKKGYLKGYADAKKEIEYATKTNPVIERYGVELKELLAYECGKPKWIPCSERLPDKNGAYLVTGKNGHVFEYDYCIYTANNVKWSYCGNEIIAWMPLPEPYKKEGEDK